MRDNDRLALIGFIALSEIAGIVGSLFTATAIPSWYTTVMKPIYTPPSWVFGPVWTTLYLLIGIAAFLVWRKGVEHKHVKVALITFFMQLALNVLWSVIFFGFHSIAGGLLEIVVLLIAIIATMARFADVDIRAAQLLIPYLMWVSFATYLTYGMWALN